MTFTPFEISYNKNQHVSKRSMNTPQSDFWNVDCLILTTDERLAGIKEVLGATCHYFLAQPFSLQQWNLVSTEQKKQLMLSERSYKMWDLSNNNSVNIFWNHMQMWKIASKKLRPMLILEDDACMSVNAGLYIKEMTSTMTNQSDLFVLKLYSNENRFSVEHPQLKCLCSNFPKLGFVAYIITPRAASILLQNCTINTHVDIFLWQEACVRQRLALIGSPSNLFTEKRSTELQIERRAHRTMGELWWIKNILNTVYEQSIRLSTPTPYCPLSV